MNVQDYYQRWSFYEASRANYQERTQGRIGPDLQAEGYRPASPWLWVAGGLEPVLPTKVVVSRDGGVQIRHEGEVSNPLAFIFGPVDLAFVVGAVLSLLAMVFTFDSIAGEKERGTLGLLMAQPVARWQVVVGKVLGAYVLLLIPLILAGVVGLIVLVGTGATAVWRGPHGAGVLLLVIGVTLVFLLAMVALGVLVSAQTVRSTTALVTLLLLWTLMVLVIPKVSPMVAAVVYPVESPQVHDLRKQLLRQNLTREWDQARRDLFDRTLLQFGLDPKEKGWDVMYAQGGQLLQVRQAYEEGRQSLDRVFEQRLQAEVDRLDQDYTNRRHGQIRIARNLARLSPVSGYTFVLTEVAGTGVTAVETLRANARRFLTEVRDQVYSKFVLHWYGSAVGQYMGIRTEIVKGFDPKGASVPHLQYQWASWPEVWRAVGIDVLLLGFYAVAFLAGAYVSFLRYDVR
ncbi:MAG: ABC transporter permease [Acidobacteria bacterium]|nr:ABC transporter permease [Acidobacteriota bacterium]MDW7984103.1 ABC transporter permease subunit [Acidobacteriota bacterium]